MHFKYEIPGMGSKRLCYIQWYERVAPGLVDEKQMVELRLKEPENCCLQIIAPDSIMRMIHLIPNFIARNEKEIFYANHYIDVDFYQRDNRK